MTTAFPAAHVKLSAQWRLSQRAMANMSSTRTFVLSAVLVQILARSEHHRQSNLIIKQASLWDACQTVEKAQVYWVFSLFYGII